MVRRPRPAGQSRRHRQRGRHHHGRRNPAHVPPSPGSQDRQEPVHLDIATAEFDAETDRLIKLGATQLNDIEQGSNHWRTFADPEGNEFDLVATAA
jgi:hypothetical protein